MPCASSSNFLLALSAFALASPKPMASPSAFSAAPFRLGSRNAITFSTLATPPMM